MIVFFLAGNSTLPFAQEIACQKLFISAQNESAKKEFYNHCANLTNRNNTQEAYFGVATAMYAELVSNPADKLSYFSQGKDKIEKAIAKYLEPGLYFAYNRKEILERTKRGKLKQFQSMI
jgi:hypothetical protein